MAYVNLGQVMYPVGAIYQSWNSTSPANLFGGQWTQITEKFLYCSNSAGGTGGASSVTLNINQIPSHYHNSGKGYHSCTQNGGPFVTNVSTEFYDQDPWSANHTSNTGGGHLTRICHPTSDVTLGEDTPNFFIGGGVVWHM